MGIASADLVEYINRTAVLPAHNQGLNRDQQYDAWVGMSHTRNFLVKMLVDLKLAEPPKSEKRDVNQELTDFAEGK